MSVWMCGSCGEFVLQPEEHWSIVDPEWRGPVEYLCGECLERYRTGVPETFVFLNRDTHTATLLSASGLRLAHLDAHGARAA
jgi:hypothetical protein